MKLFGSILNLFLGCLFLYVGVTNLNPQLSYLDFGMAIILLTLGRMELQ